MALNNSQNQFGQLSYDPIQAIVVLSNIVKATYKASTHTTPDLLHGQEIRQKAEAKILELIESL